MDLFDQRHDVLLRKNAPLADRMRPQTLDEFVGQEQIIGPGRLLRRAIQVDQLSSLIFYGPPGTGKTTLARIIANTTKAQFLSINAVLAGVKDIREAIAGANKTLGLHSKRTILFVDEVHRFNKAQQDALLPHVENGVLILIGATTENPYFEVNKALVSRSRIFQLRPLTDEDLRSVAHQALSNKERGYGAREVRIDEDALEHLVQTANGDARGVLNALELAVETTAPESEGAVHITRSVAEESIQKRAVLYDKDGDVHYDTVSAFIKSVRGSDPDAALYWMARMVYAGEDPRFIFRRLLILACEDIGLADPHALGVVLNSARAFDYVGMPEGRYHLAHACLYLATAAKSNSSMAFFDALDAVAKEAESDDVPNHLRDASRDGEGLGHGKGYLYPHAYRDHWVAQQYLPELLQGRVFYQPADQGYEQQIRLRVTGLREAMLEAMVEEPVQGPFGGAEPGSTTKEWANRTDSEVTLAGIRDKVLELACVSRNSLVLDLHARTGLLTFEAMRRSLDGGVWALAHDEKSFSALTAMGEQLDPLLRPHVILAAWESFDKEILREGGSDLRFTAIVGRNLLARHDDKGALVRRVLPFLHPEGICVLAEVVPSLGQRLSDILAFSGGAQELEEQFRNAEASLFGDESNPMVNWNDRTLERDLGEALEVKAAVQCESRRAMRRISTDDIDSWFRKSSKSEPRSLGDHLREAIDAESIGKLRASMVAQLGNRDVSWQTTVAYVRITR